MNVYFEITALFHSAIRWGERAAISKLTYIWTPLSRSYIVFALVWLTTVHRVEIGRN